MESTIVFESALNILWSYPSNFRETYRKKSLKRCHPTTSSEVTSWEGIYQTESRNSYRKFVATGYYCFIVFPNKQTFVK